VTVPADAAVTVNANRGDIHIASIKTSVAATANHGNVELSAITGTASVDINSAGSSLTAHNLDDGIAFRGHAQDITLADIKGPVTINGEVFGATLLERLNGTVHFHTSRADVQFARLDGEMQISGSGISADQAQGPAVISTNNHGVTLDRVAGDIAITDRYGAIELTAAPALGNITIEDKNGSVKATLPEHAGFDIAAVTTNGDIDTNFSVGSSTRGSSSGDGSSHDSDSRANQRTLNGTVAAGGPTVRITTANGDISIMKGDVQPLAGPPAAQKITLAPVAPKNAKVPGAAAVAKATKAQASAVAQQP
jgi:DUF4097 and DUF4098 domain-containing protein YvlB